MKIRVALPLAAGILAAATGAASAASMAYCDRYAKSYIAVLQYANRLVENADENGSPAISDDRLNHLYARSHAQCLNRDDDPALPTMQGYAEAEGNTAAGAAAKEMSLGTAGTHDPVAPADPVQASDAIAAGKQAMLADPPATSTKSSSGPQASGLKQGSTKWVGWCKSNYKSFNPKTGMILTGSGKTMRCP